MQAVTTRNEQYGELHVDSPPCFCCWFCNLFCLYAAVHMLQCPSSTRHSVMKFMLLVLKT